MAVRIELPQFVSDNFFSLLHSKSCQFDGTYAIYDDIAIGADDSLECFLTCTPHVNDHIISGSQTIIGRRGHVLVGFKCQKLIVKDIAPKDLALILEKILVINQRIDIQKTDFSVELLLALSTSFVSALDFLTF